MAALEFTRRFDRLHGLAADRGGVDPRTLVGAWVNFDLASKGVVEVAIAQQEADLTVRTFGACSPSPCDWGTVGAEAFAGVGDRDAVGFKAHYDFGSVDTLLVAYLNLRPWWSTATPPSATRGQRALAVLPAGPLLPGCGEVAACGEVGGTRAGLKE